MPLIDPATEAMLMIDAQLPVFWCLSSIFGSAALIAMYMARTFRLKLKSQSFGVHSSTVP